MIEKNNPTSNIDNLYISLSEMVKSFGELEDIKFDNKSIEEQNIIKTAEILLNKKIYSDSFTQV